MERHSSSTDKKVEAPHSVLQKDRRGRQQEEGKQQGVALVHRNTTISRFSEWKWKVKLVKENMCVREDG